MRSPPVDTVIVFDLDDTLYKEADYVDSTFRAVAGGDECLYDSLKKVGRPYDAFETLAGEDERDRAVELYRSGEVGLDDTEGARQLLEALRDRGAKIAVVTDGWGRRQRAKIDTLRLTPLVDMILISEEVGSGKLSGVAFRQIMDRWPGHRYVYVGDNPAKDFVVPNRLGWLTVMIGPDERNIHHNPPELFPENYRPQISVDRLCSLLSFDGYRIQQDMP